MSAKLSFTRFDEISTECHRYHFEYRRDEAALAEETSLKGGMTNPKTHHYPHEASPEVTCRNFVRETCWHPPGSSRKSSSFGLKMIVGSPPSSSLSSPSIPLMSIGWLGPPSTAGQAKAWAPFVSGRVSVRDSRAAPSPRAGGSSRLNKPGHRPKHDFVALKLEASLDTGATCSQISGRRGSVQSMMGDSRCAEIPLGHYYKKPV